MKHFLGIFSYEQMEQEDFRFTDLYENCTMLIDIPDAGLKMGDGCNWVSADHFIGLLTFEGWDPNSDYNEAGLRILGYYSFRDQYIKTHNSRKVIDDESL